MQLLPSFSPATLGRTPPPHAHTHGVGRCVVLASVGRDLGASAGRQQGSSILVLAQAQGGRSGAGDRKGPRGNPDRELGDNGSGDRKGARGNPDREPAGNGAGRRDDRGDSRVRKPTLSGSQWSKDGGGGRGQAQGGRDWGGGGGGDQGQGQRSGEERSRGSDGRERGSFQRGPAFFERAGSRGGGSSSGGGSDSNGGASNSELNNAIMRCESIAELSNLAKLNLRQFNNVNLSTALSRTAKLERTGSAAARILAGDVLSEAIADHLTALRSRDLSSIVWSYAKLGVTPRNGLLPMLLQEANNKLPWSATSKMKEFEPQGIANTLWALARLEHEDAGFVAALLKTAGPKLKDFEPQHLANTIWALATMRHNDPYFVSQLLAAAKVKLPLFNPQNLSNTLWALATLNQRPGAPFLTLLLTTAIPAKVSQFNAQDVANTLWALATLGENGDAAFLTKLLSQAERKLPDFNPQNIANTAWALAIFGRYDAPFLASLVDKAKLKLHDFSSQNISNLSLALSTFSALDEELVEMIQKQTLKLGSSNTARHCSTTALAVAKLGCQLSPETGKAVADAQAGSFTTKDVCDLAWAHALTGDPYQPWLVRLVLNHVFGSWLEGSDGGLPSDVDLQLQLYQYTLELLEGGRAAELSDADRESIQQLNSTCRDVWTDRTQSKGSLAPAFLQSVLDACSKVPGWQVLGQELLTEDMVYSVDVAVLAENEFPGGEAMKIALLLDSPRHCTRSKPFKQLGPTLARERGLGRRGWAVMSIPFFDWDQDMSLEDNVALLQSKAAALRYKDKSASAKSSREGEASS